MMARNATVPLTGRIQKRKTNHLRIITFGLQRAAGPYIWAISGHSGFDPAAVPLPRGRVMMNSVNMPGSVSTSIRPPCCLTIMS
jgi:hypothetical protein